ncbi:DUF2784 domain-containing protein [Pseudomonas anguilliseptica]|uniref:DUF2784 domain-containing protein n=1 Tax=Pseudomonas anguilliseptica TaxID=53406 RepID=UPI0022B056F2|nr:DUF2784 domain-containing protein [Pseudomonas anguilliseptica]MCZ4323467.1 DUF2784 domain-containing protein [Pseudomonas anguilliseptica]
MFWLAVAADAVVVVHLLFILFVVLGGLLVWRWREVVWLHVPAALWGVLVELMRWPCPLTPLEHSLRAAAGQAGYSGGFVEHYLLPVIYPAGLTPQIQIGLGLFVLLLNGLIYGVLFWQRWRRP